MVIVWISAILLPYHLPIHGPIVGQTVLRDLFNLLPLMFAPLLASRLFPNSNSIPMKKWIHVVGLLFLLDLAVSFSATQLHLNGFAENYLNAILIEVVAFIVSFLILDWRRTKG